MTGLTAAATAGDGGGATGSTSLEFDIIRWIRLRRVGEDEDGGSFDAGF